MSPLVFINVYVVTVVSIVSCLDFDRVLNVKVMEFHTSVGERRQ